MALDESLVLRHVGDLPEQLGNQRYAFSTLEDGTGLSAKFEFMAWRLALHGHFILAHREIYGTQPTRNAENVRVAHLRYDRRLLDRVPMLLAMHEKGQIDLTLGPWDFYGTCDEIVGKEMGRALV